MAVRASLREESLEMAAGSSSSRLDVKIQCLFSLKKIVWNNDRKYVMEFVYK